MFYLQYYWINTSDFFGQVGFCAARSRELQVTGSGWLCFGFPWAYRHTQPHPLLHFLLPTYFFNPFAGKLKLLTARFIFQKATLTT